MKPPTIKDHTNHLLSQNEGHVRRLITHFGLILLAILLVSCGGLASAQTPTPTPTPTPSEEELKLQEEKRLLDLKKDIAVAKKAIRDAQPQPSATPLTGDTTLSEGVRLETEMVSYKAMSEVANEISREIRVRVPTPNNLAIYDAQVIRDWRFHQALFPAFRGQAKDIRDNYIKLLCLDAASGASVFFRSTHCADSGGNPFSPADAAAVRENAKTEAVSEAIGAGAALIKSFVDLTALFRTETKIEGKQVTIDNNALVAEVFRGLKNHYGCNQPPVPVPCAVQSVSLYYPGVFPPRTINESETIKRIGQLFIFKTEAERIIKQKTAAKQALVSVLNALVAQKNQAGETLDKVKELNEVVKNLNDALTHETILVFRRKLWEEKQDSLVQLGKLPSEGFLVAQIAGVSAAIAAKKLAIEAIDAPVKDLTELNERFQSFVDQFLKLDASGSNALALFIKSEDIQNIMGNDNSYWLEIRSVSAGGNNRTRKNLIWFFAGARVDHSGGAIIEYTLYNQSGAVVYSDKRAYYEGYIQPKKIKKGKLVDTIK